jgi:lysozyme family protein
MKLITNGGLTLSLNSKNAGNENLTLSYSASYGSYLNDYTTRADGVTPTYKYRIVQVVTTGYKIDAISLLALFSFSSNYSYEDVVRNSFKHLEAISYTFTNQITISLYHVNKGPLLKANTYENNLDFYNQETSVLTLAVSTAF